jgi:DNA-binding transcriptional ArsR family regulator
MTNSTPADQLTTRPSNRDIGQLGEGCAIGQTDGTTCLDKKICRWESPPVLDIAVIDDPAAAEASLDPVRARLLAELVEPGSATMLAAKVGLSRQKVNYHLNALERHGLVELVAERKKGNVTERVLQATAASYVISPNALAAVAPDPNRSPDQLSAWWMLALAARLVRELGDLIAGATAARQRIATFAIDSEIRFASAADRAAFAEELSGVIATLVTKYHNGTAEGGRKHRLVLALHPSITKRGSTRSDRLKTVAAPTQSSKAPLNGVPLTAPAITAKE